MSQNLTLDAKIAIREEADGKTVLVVPFCPQRPDLSCHFSISIGRDTANARALARRMVLAIQAGKAYPNPKVAIDCTNQEYVTFDLNVTGRYLKSDLKRLGF